MGGPAKAGVANRFFMTAVYGILGHPIAQSLSPVMFEAAFFAYNIDAECRKFDVTPADLKTFLVKAKADGVAGLSVTVPHKETIMEFLNEIDEKAEEIGAVNTVVNKGGKFKGYNTDYFGALKALEEVTSLEGKKILVIGAGGAAAAIVYGCRKAGGIVTVLNRGEQKAKELADRFGCGYGTIDEILQHQSHVLVHTTTVGMVPNTGASLVPPQYFKKGLVVMDIVYNPLETRLVKDARAAGCRIIPGHKMLLYQAEKQFEIWFKKKPPLEKMEQALLKALKA
jgi:shikimate dehydrogenase